MGYWTILFWEFIDLKSIKILMATMAPSSNPCSSQIQSILFTVHFLCMNLHQRDTILTREVESGLPIPVLHSLPLVPGLPSTVLN